MSYVYDMSRDFKLSLHCRSTQTLIYFWRGVAAWAGRFNTFRTQILGGDVAMGRPNYIKLWKDRTTMDDPEFVLDFRYDASFSNQSAS